MEPSTLTILEGEPLDAKLREQNKVLLDCVGIAIQELRFVELPNTIRAVRAIRERLNAAGVKVR